MFKFKILSDILIESLSSQNLNKWVITVPKKFNMWFSDPHFQEQAESRYRNKSIITKLGS